MDIAAKIKTPHNTRLLKAIRDLRAFVQDLVDYSEAHPIPEQVTTPEEIAAEKKIKNDLHSKNNKITAQLAVVKGLYRTSVMKVREEKKATTHEREVTDGLILGLQNLQYEETSLRSEIKAAEEYE